MTTSNRFSSGTSKLLLGTVLAISGIFVFALPSFAHAAMYAYVNTSGEVSTVNANDWQTALVTAPNIGLHSGVMLLVSQFDFNIVGNSI